MTNLLAARSTAVVVSQLEKAGCPVVVACPVPSFDATPYCTLREQRQMDRPTLLALTAALDAVRDSGLDCASGMVAPEMVGTSVGTGMGALSAAEEIAAAFADRPADVPPYTVPRLMASSAAARISIRTGARGPSLTYSMACASGATAIGEAMLKIRYGEVDAMVAGGVDAGITPVVMGSFARVGALSRRQDEPHRICRPFAADRDGFVMGEGAAFLVLEEWDLAVRRGAEIIGELCGYGSNSDAHHIVAPQPDGVMAARCMRAAIDDAGLPADAVGHVNAHGTSTPFNDAAEAQAVADVFGPGRIATTATKGVVGHLLGASGAFEAAVSLMCAADGLVPPVANLAAGEHTDLLDLVVEEPRRIRPAPVVSNSFGFGGHNACLVLAPPPGAVQ
jgi:3-oxoacyl-[acyl-carrier-protein] synthase II